MLAEPAYLVGGLEPLLRQLGRHQYQRFVVFFDDLDAEALDWSHLRHQIGGHLACPENVALVTAWNHPFPAMIRGWCATLDFRPIDPQVCLEIPDDYLHQQVGLSAPCTELAGVLAGDFVAEYVAGMLPELTPRTLMPYLERLEKDPKRRASLWEEAQLPPTRRPTMDHFVASTRKIIEELNRDRERYRLKPEQFFE